MSEFDSPNVQQQNQDVTAPASFDSIKNLMREFFESRGYKVGDTDRGLKVESEQGQGQQVGQPGIAGPGPGGLLRSRVVLNEDGLLDDLEHTVQHYGEFAENCGLNKEELTTRGKDARYLLVNYVCELCGCSRTDPTITDEQFATIFCALFATLDFFTKFACAQEVGSARGKDEENRLKTRLLDQLIQGRRR